MTFPLKTRTPIWAVSLLLLLSGAVLGLQAQVKTTKKLQHAPIPYSDPVSGTQMYKDYCASCHGMSGKGDGPAVEFLKEAPPDLRTLARRHNGKYPARDVAGTLLFGTKSHAHGTVDMPLWGDLFTLQNAHVAHLRVRNIAAHIESLQQR